MDLDGWVREDVMGTFALALTAVAAGVHVASGWSSAGYPTPFVSEPALAMLAGGGWLVSLVFALLVLGLNRASRRARIAAWSSAAVLAMLVVESGLT
jgi:hypothetical protein